jgi:hypothetical protein
MGLFSLITLAALVTVGDIVVRLDRTGPRATVQAALSTRVSSAQAGPAGDPMLTDAATGLSYELLGDPWHGGCPGAMSTAEFRWTGGEAAVAGRLRGGTDWYGNACSERLPQRFRGIGLWQAAWGMADAIEPAYYGGLRHSVTNVRSASITVGGKPGWLAEFLVRYDRGQHLAWSTELAAVVVTKTAVFYVSVPDNLGTYIVATLVSSLR